MNSYQRARTNLAIVSGLAMSAAGTVSAQNYEVRFGGPNTQEIAYDIVETASAGSVVVGSIDTRGGDIYAVRFNAFGTRLWSRAIGGTQNDTGYSVTATSDGGFVIAAEVQSNPPAAGLTTALVKLNAGGLVLWSNVYTGTTTDPVHTPLPGPVVIETPDKELVFINNFQGLPQVGKTDDVGNLIWHVGYADPRDDRSSLIAFTDVKLDVDGNIVVSGTIRSEIQGAGNIQDAFLLRVDPTNGAPIRAFQYDLTPPGSFERRETGDGLDVYPLDGRVAVAGRVNAGTGGPLLAQHMFVVDSGLASPIAGNIFGTPGNVSNITGYSAVRFGGNAFRDIVIGGAFGPPGGEATLTAFNANGNFEWRYHSADQAEFNAVTPSLLTCGYLVAGRTSLGGSNDFFLVKTLGNGRTPCNRANQIQILEVRPRIEDIPLVTINQERQERWITEEIVPQFATNVLCADTRCDNCPGDIADAFGTLGADGTVDFGDFLALLGLIGPCPGMLAGCTGDIADSFGTLGGDGTVDFGDFLALLGLIGPCP